MNLEGLTLRLLTNTLEKELLGSKIYKIFMPSPHTLLLLVRRSHDTTALIGDINGESPALYIPFKLPENPETPPAFCMLLRKHLEEGRITKITQSGLDRIITLEIDLLGASSKLITKKLIFELTGKNSNIILTQDDIIIDSLKHIGTAQNTYRSILPGKAYIAPPPQDGNDILLTAPEEIVKTANNLPAANFLKAFINTTTGIGKATATELLKTAAILPGEIRLEPISCQSLTKVLTNLQSSFAKQLLNHPVYALISKTNRVKTILSLPPQETDAEITIKEFADINTAINFAVSLHPIQLPQHEYLQKLVTAEINKLTKKLTSLQEDLSHAEDAESQRMLADTIMANIYLLQKGQTQAVLTNIYDGQQVKIQLSPILTPTENAQAYYKRYNKFKRAQSEIRLQITATEEMLTYLETLDSSLTIANTKNEIEEIKQEMISIGLIKTFGKKKSASLQKSQPLHLKLTADTDLYIGKNNKQNDYVTFTIGGPKDLWFHTKDIPGSHVLLKNTTNEFSQEDILLATAFAAYFSKAKNGSNVPVDCVPRRFVKKPNGSKPGFVIFTNQSTYYTTPDIKTIEKYLK